MADFDSQNRCLCSMEDLMGHCYVQYALVFTWKYGRLLMKVSRLPFKRMQGVTVHTTAKERLQN